MARVLTPRQLAAQIEKWAAVGIDFALVQSAAAALEEDRRESAARAPRRSGRLASTIRVVRPSSTRAGRTGILRLSLTAGSGSSNRGKRVEYASVLQTGQVFGGIEKIVTSLT